MPLVNLWNPATTHHNKTGPAQSKAPVDPKSEQPAEAIYNVSFKYNDQNIDNFPLAYILKHFNSPAVYLEVLRSYGILNQAIPQNAGKTLFQIANEQQANGRTLIQNFTDVLNKTIDDQLVIKNPKYAQIKIYFQTLSNNVSTAARENAQVDDSTKVDFMDIVKTMMALEMSGIQKGTREWDAIRQLIFREFGSKVADAQGLANASQQKFIKENPVQIKGLVYQALRGLGAIRQ